MAEAGRATQQMLCVSWCPSWGSGPTHPITWVQSRGPGCRRARPAATPTRRAQAGTAQRRVVRAPRALESGEQVPVSHPLGSSVVWVGYSTCLAKSWETSCCNNPPRS